MPRIYRAMFAAGDKPMIGANKRMLGAQLGEGRYDDLPADAEGKVGPGKGGMSVAPDWRSLPRHRIPMRLNDKLESPTASGNNQLKCWRYGAGRFISGALTQEIRLVVDSATHGTVEPAEKMPAVEYQAALAATQPDWECDED